jgi:hypothetical protein
MKIETYTLMATNGKRIRRATKVVFNTGREIKFMDKLTKSEAISAALVEVQR